jgi:hypothetical protein
LGSDRKHWFFSGVPPPSAGVAAESHPLVFGVFFFLGGGPFLLLGKVLPAAGNGGGRPRPTNPDCFFNTWPLGTSAGSRGTLVPHSFAFEFYGGMFFLE